MEALLQKKIIQCEELEKAVGELRAENAIIQKRIGQLEHERSRQQEAVAEMNHASEKTRESLSKNKKRCETLSQAIQSAKRIMAAVLAVTCMLMANCFNYAQRIVELTRVCYVTI